MSDKKECFVISPIGEEGSETRDRSDKVLEYVIEPAIRSYGYEPVRADNIEEPGMITSQVIERVVESSLVIADLTGSNPNVFYELAVRHAYNEPFIQLINKNEDIPFDVAGSRIIQFDVEDIESAHNAQDEIQNQIETIESDGFRNENPISVATDLKNLRESGDPESESVADIKEAIAELRNSMTMIQNMLNNPEDIFPEEYIFQVIKEIESKDMSQGRFTKEEKETILELLDDAEATADDIIWELDESHVDVDEIESLADDIKDNVNLAIELLQTEWMT